MAATRQDISGWFDGGVEVGATHMLVVCDEFDYDDYPVWVLPGDGKTVQEVFEDYSGRDMQRVMEVYALHLDKEAQLNGHRAFHFDPAPSTIISEEP